MARVTVYIPAYNHERFVGDAIQSVLDQTFTDFELIVTDDASTDGTLAEIRRFDDPRLKVFALPQNRGASVAANHCLAQATGDYVCPLSSDDRFHPEKLRSQVDYLDAHPEVMAVTAQPTFIDEDGNPIIGEHGMSSIFTRENRSREDWLRHFFDHGNCLCHPTAMIRRSAYHLAGGGYHELMRQLPDFDFWVRLCIIGQIHVMEEQMTFFRLRDGNQNVSAPTLDNLAGILHEHAFILRHYLEPAVMDNIVSIFGPEWGPPRPPQLALAELALARGSPSHRLFAVETLLQTSWKGLDETTHAMLLERARPILREADVLRERELARLNEELLRQSGARIQQRTKTQLLRDKLAAMQVRLENTRSRLEKMESTLSWKLTKPFRQLGRLFGRKD